MKSARALPVRTRDTVACVVVYKVLPLLQERASHLPGKMFSPGAAFNVPDRRLRRLAHGGM